MSISFAQVVEPVKWKSSIEKISDTEYDIIITANIDEGWHLYSQHNPEGASLPIEFDSDQVGETFEFVGKAKESKTEKKYSKVWKKEEIFFVKSAVLKQRIKITDTSTTKIEILLFGQVCKDACIQIEETFIFDLK
jgi:thiol:disulfide interchange protein DsbD